MPPFTEALCAQQEVVAVEPQPSRDGGMCLEGVREGRVCSASCPPEGVVLRAAEFSTELSTGSRWAVLTICWPPFVDNVVGVEEDSRLKKRPTRPLNGAREGWRCHCRAVTTPCHIVVVWCVVGGGQSRE